MAMTLLEWPASPGFPEPLWYGVEDLHRLLLWATDQAVSDVTIQANQPVVVERYGRLFPVTRRRLAPAEVYHLHPGDLWRQRPQPAGRRRGHRLLLRDPARAARSGALPGEHDGRARRARARRGDHRAHHRHHAADPGRRSTCRPASGRSLVFEQGLVLITGPTGSGKTTLLARSSGICWKQPALPPEDYHLRGAHRVRLRFRAALSCL